MQAYIVCYIFRLHGVFLAIGGLITRGCESAEKNYCKG